MKSTFGGAAPTAPATAVRLIANYQPALGERIITGDQYAP
jgi:hypothetical protein